MKIRTKFILITMVILVICVVLICTPDTDAETMHAKYGGTDANYVLDSPSYKTPGKLNLHYRDQGDPGGQPIVFIHGSNASLHTWTQTIAHMPQTYRFISMDLPGHGLSGPHPEHSYSADSMIAAINTVLDKLGVQKAVFVGNSMGGWVSWRYALKHSGRVDALILVNAAGIPTTVKPPLNIGFRLMRNPLTRPLTEWITPRFMVKKSIEQTVYDASKVRTDTIDLYWELLRYPGNRKASVHRASLDLELEYAERLHQIIAPTLIIWGRHDQLISLKSAQSFKDTIPQADLIIYDAVGHIPMEEVPARFADDITVFLQKTASPKISQPH